VITSTAAPDWIGWSTRFVLFTGKGGVGKTTVAAATAVALSDLGRRVLVVSTDPASNLDDVLGAEVGQEPTPVPGAVGLFALNLDPELAADAYRESVLEPLRGVVPDDELASVQEQLAGQCTVEVAAFDEFSRLLAVRETTQDFEHVVFDTAPTGHTLRLLSLPAAWSHYIADNPEGASCLGPLASLPAKQQLYDATVEALGDEATTSVVLVSRPEHTSLREAARTGEELQALGISNQRLILNGLLAHPAGGDSVASAFRRRQDDAVAALPAPLGAVPNDVVPLVASDLCGVDELRALVDGRVPVPDDPGPVSLDHAIPDLGGLVDDVAVPGHGVVMVMGKGGVGKTTVAAALALGLLERGYDVHLSTTDPAGRLDELLHEVGIDGLTVSRIDPVEEVRRYTEEKLRGAATLDPARRALVEEDLRSPCTEEIAVFSAFSRLLREGRKGFVVLDTAPSGHTLLLLDRTGAYHHEVMRSTADVEGRVTTPLMWLQDPTRTKVVLVALPQATPVQEAADLQTDLRRAEIEPYAWVINGSLAASGTADPLLRCRAVLERRHIARVRDELARRLHLVPWSSDPAGLEDRLGMLAAP
jgi:arsenite/tail-anchored protein-transporting ATPase